MIFGAVEACLGALLLLASGAGDVAELDALLASLARQPPQTIAFVETHRSPLLEGDLVVSGELEYRGPGRLSRIVTAPTRERTDIDGTDVRIQREGRPERRFSLRHSAELGGLLSAFSALLAGDRAALEESFTPRLERGPEGWQLDLVPRSMQAGDRIERIRVRGRGDAPASIEIVTKDGTAGSIIRLGEQARVPGEG